MRKKYVQLLMICMRLGGLMNEGIHLDLDTWIGGLIWLEILVLVRVTELPFVSWFDLSGNVACSKPTFHAHMKCAIEPHLHFNMMRFRLGCWYLRANDLKSKSTNIPRGERVCQLCLQVRHMNLVEDED